MRLKVAEADQRDVGKGVVRVNRETMEELGVDAGDIVRIEGSRTTAATALKTFLSDEGEDIIRMDGLMRTNAGTSIGEIVGVEPARWKEAKSVTLAPALKGMRIFAPSESIKSLFMNRAITRGDILSTTSFRRPREPSGSDLMFEELFRDFFEQPAFGLGEVKLQVVSTTPSAT